MDFDNDMFWKILEVSEQFELLRIFSRVINLQYQMILDVESEGNFNIRSLKKVNRLTENLVSRSSTKNADIDIVKSAEMDGNEIAEVKGKIDYVHELLMVESLHQTQESMMKSMMEKILDGQKKMFVDFSKRLDSFYNELNGKFEALNTHIKKRDILFFFLTLNFINFGI